MIFFKKQFSSGAVHLTRRRFGGVRMTIPGERQEERWLFPAILKSVYFANEYQSEICPEPNR